MPRDREYLLDILEAAQAARSYVMGKTQDDILEDRHQYDDIDMLIIWDTVHNDIPPLIAALEKTIRS